MELLAVILAVLLIAIPVIVLGVLFVWAAIKDGQEDRALQKRLGIRRRERGIAAAAVHVPARDPYRRRRP